MPLLPRNDRQFTIFGKAGGVQPEPITTSTPFFFQNDSDTPLTIQMKQQGSGTKIVSFKKSDNGTEWTDFNVYSITTIQPNSRLYLRGENNGSLSTVNVMYNYFVTSGGNFSIGGNINSLVHDDFETNSKLYSYSFFYLFKENTNLTDASKLILPYTTLAEYSYCGLFTQCTSLTTAPSLPATTLADNCYSEMFKRCTSLTTAPALPATTLARYCYKSMFEVCKSLTTAPALPATTAELYCYSSMFSGCTSLTTPPELPATTLANSCYSSMFNICTSLTTPPELPATTLTQNCYSSMFYGCTSLTTAPALPATTAELYCYSSMFNGCTSLTTPPELPATTLANSCYSSMFNGCTSLTEAPALPATTLMASCYSLMFFGCTSLTTAPLLPATTLMTSCYSLIFKGCKSLNNITIYATDISASNCLNSWVNSVSSTGTFTKKSGVTYPTGVSGIPEGWTVVEIEEPKTGKTITFTPSEYTYDARYSIDGGDDVYVEEGTTATIVLPDTSTTISFNCQKGIGDWYINGVEKADQMSRPWNVNVADLNDGDVITCDISS